MSDIESTRKEIDKIDKLMAELFEKRMDEVKKVAEYKIKNALPILDESREEKVIKKNCRLIKNKNYTGFYTQFLKNTMKISKAYQRNLCKGLRIAFSGVEGAFAQIAANKIFKNAETLGYADFSSAYKAVENGECDCAVLPLENSYNGDVGAVMDLAFSGSLSVTGIYDILIVQNLLGIKGASLESVTKVISHPQALGQCAAFIKKHNLQVIEAENTALAAQKVLKLNKPDIAAIASEEAAEKYGLIKIESHINSAEGNTTRFAVFSRSAAQIENKNNFIMCFTVKNEAGALGKAVSVIGSFGFNLRSLKSRPSKDSVWSYYFFAEGEGNINTPNGKEMIDELKKHCNSVKIIGVYNKEITLK